MQTCRSAGRPAVWGSAGLPAGRAGPAQSCCAAAWALAGTGSAAVAPARAAGRGCRHLFFSLTSRTAGKAHAGSGQAAGLEPTKRQCNCTTAVQGWRRRQDHTHASAPRQQRRAERHTWECGVSPCMATSVCSPALLSWWLSPLMKLPAGRGSQLKAQPACSKPGLPVRNCSCRSRNRLLAAVGGSKGAAVGGSNG